MALAIIGGASGLGGVLGAVMRGVEWIGEAISGKKTQQFQTCKCNKAAQVKVSVTPNDFGRRYMCCFHRGEQNDCKYFEWIDPQIDDLVKEVINRYMKNVQSLESENVLLKSTNKKQKEKIKTLESTVHGLKLELDKEKNSLKLTSRFLWISLAMNMMLILGMTVVPRRKVAVA